MPRIQPGDWRPIDVASLEPEAERAVRSMKHTVVVAGPGAGKTELLAQRACYLLQTRLCPLPRRILAISFKRDAAKNLRDRVERRCGSDVGRYFESYTFDAFAKGLVDRFRLSIPVQFRPTADYTIAHFTAPRCCGIPRRTYANGARPAQEPMSQQSPERTFSRTHSTGFRSSTSNTRTPSQHGQHRNSGANQ